MFNFETYTLIDWLSLGGSVFLLGYLISIYNKLVTLKNDVKEGYSNIEVSLKQRNEEIPKLVDTILQYAKHEKAVFTDLFEARNSVQNAALKPENAAQLSIAETQLKEALGRIYVLAEDTPEIQANENFTQMQTRISVLDSEISDRREYYNACVNNNNTVIGQFPDLIIAKIFGFKEFDLLKFSDTELKDHDIKSLFGAGVQGA